MPFIRPATGGVSGSFALQFPSNSGPTNKTDPYAVIEFANPQSDGLPIWGASGAGVTVIRKLRTPATFQTGYNAQFWWSRSDGSFDGENSGYWGMHPYPVRGFDIPNDYSGQGHFIHELATRGEDVIDSTGLQWLNSSKNTGFTGSNFAAITAGTRVLPSTTYLQGMRVTRNNADSKNFKYYFNLPNVDSANYIERTITVAGYGESSPPSPKVTIGDSPWYAAFQHERADCILDAIKIFNAVLTEQEMLDESADFSKIVTSAGQAAIWWGRNGFDTGHDTNGGTILCHYGTGRSFAIVNPGPGASDKMSLVARI